MVFREIADTLYLKIVLRFLYQFFILLARVSARVRGNALAPNQAQLKPCTYTLYSGTNWLKMANCLQEVRPHCPLLPCLLRT